LGIALMAAGGTLAFACIATFVSRGVGTPAPIDPPRKFVAAGPYQFVRNPMYIGGFLVLAGFGLYERSPAILLFALPWLLLAHLFVIFYEEPHLRATFGSPYDAYCRISAPHLAPPTTPIAARCAGGCLAVSRFGNCPVIEFLACRGKRHVRSSRQSNQLIIPTWDLETPIHRFPLAGFYKPFA